MDRWLVVLIAFFAAVAVLLPLGLLAFFPTPTPLGRLELEAVHENLAFPGALAFAPDGRLFYTELRNGVVRIVADGMVQPQPFLTLNVVTLPESGLLGLELDPNFANSAYVYVYYTYEAGGTPFNRVSRFRDLGGVAGPEQILLDGLGANERHNSGRLRFGPDGLLYVSVGDVLNAGNSQDLDSLNGKILRMEANGSIPASNPFPNSSVYALGIRNVFGMDFTAEGTLVFTENGPIGDDEVNLGVPGGNYGWPEVRGMAHDPRFEDPILVFSPAIAPTGVGFYGGSLLGPAYLGTTFFTSWNDGGLRTIRRNGTSFQADLELTLGRSGLVAVAAAPDGALYASSQDAIYRVVFVEIALGEDGSATSGLSLIPTTASSPLVRNVKGPTPVAGPNPRDVRSGPVA